MNDPLSDKLFVPISEERAVLSTREVVTAKVRVTTRVETHQELIQEALRREDVAVERVAVGRDVDVAPAIRQEGDVFVYPIVEERLVVEKRLFLKEELRITYRVTTEEVAEVVDLRKVHADVERTPVDVAPTPSSKTDRNAQ